MSSSPLDGASASSIHRGSQQVSNSAVQQVTGSFRVVLHLLIMTKIFAPAHSGSGSVTVAPSLFGLGLCSLVSHVYQLPAPSMNDQVSLWWFSYLELY